MTSADPPTATASMTSADPPTVTASMTSADSTTATASMTSSEPTTTMPTMTSVDTSTSTLVPCMTVSGAVPGVPCVFPFTHFGVIFTSCTKKGGYIKPWCSTLTDTEGNHVPGNWGDCSPSCPGVLPTPPSCSTVYGPGQGQPCIFPFKHSGRTFWKCTRFGGYHNKWCSTKVDENGNHL